MSDLNAALWPVFLIILLGYGLSARGFPAKGFWPQAEKLTYYVLFPALLIDNLSGADMIGLPVFGLGLVLALATVAVALVVILLRERMPVADGPAFTSLFQGSIRMNTYVALSLAWAFLEQRGLVLSSVAIMVLIPLINVFCVTVLSRFGKGGEGRSPGVLAELVRNPLILACVVGVALNASGMGQPFGQGSLLHILGRAALPMGLLAVGAGLRFGRILEHKAAILASSGIRLLVLPGLTLLLCLVVGFPPESRLIAVVFTAVPTASSAFILARQLGGDHELMAAIITAQTALAAATLPLWLEVAG